MEFKNIIHEYLCDSRGLEGVLMFESVKIETTTSQGYKSPYIFIEVVLLYIFFKDLSLNILGQ
jgi:hypothetical protein